MGLIDFVCLAISLPTASTLALYLLINKGTDGSVFTDRQDGRNRRKSAGTRSHELGGMRPLVGTP
ncbi:hypothetical protein Misp03_26850 [Microbispora sp. NBRC 16548]|nr:hypothetical protein Misp03_26850 [Microbispora sp. NBRC 16548]